MMLVTSVSAPKTLIIRPQSRPIRTVIKLIAASRCATLGASSKAVFRFTTKATIAVQSDGDAQVS